MWERLRRVSPFTVAWAVWIALFLVVELVALRRQAKGDTFSEHWWSANAWVRERVPKPVMWLVLGGELAFGVWLVGHLAFGLWTV